MMRFPLTVTAGLFMTGCHHFGTWDVGGQRVSDAYAGHAELRVLDAPSPLRADQQVPVLSTPEVFSAYVPTHARGDLMIGEHWIFFKLRDAEWLADRLADPDPPADGETPPERLRPLRDLDWSKVVVPYTRKAPTAETLRR